MLNAGNLPGVGGGRGAEPIGAGGRNDDGGGGGGDDNADAIGNRIKSHFSKFKFLILT